jgi:23S rRNA (cytidine1920-2'-O)/16S rRNA (cytidine1409-2'-O)-methyltransferase
MGTRRHPLPEILTAREPPVDDPLAAIAERRVMVDGAVVTNPRSLVRADARIVVRPRKAPQGVRKLSYALDRFGVEVGGKVCLDLGASTGGFTLALLERGARLVFAVDVGFGQLLGSLQQDPRVVSLERTNVADVTSHLLGTVPDLIVVDVTKLKLRDVGAQLVANRVPGPGTELVGLVKPMFELARGELPTSREELEEACAQAAAGLAASGWSVLGTIESIVRGHRGAVEFFVHARWPAG